MMTMATAALQSTPFATCCGRAQLSNEPEDTYVDSLICSILKNLEATHFRCQLFMFGEIHLPKEQDDC